MSNPAPTLNQINAFNATQGTTIDFNIIGGTEVIRSNKIYIYDLSDNSLICTHLYVSTESIHELPPNTSSSIVYASGKSSADFTNNTQYYAQIQTFTDVGGTQGGSGLSIAKLFWCLPTPILTLSTIPTTISTTSYNVSATYTPNTSGGATNEIQEFQFNLYSAIGALLQTSGVVLYGEGVDLSYNFSGLEVDSTYYVTLDVTTTQGMNVSAQSNTFTVSIDTPTMGSASVVNNGCDGYISVTSNLSSEYEHEESAEAGEIMSFTTDSVNDITELDVDFSPVQDGTPWMSAQDTEPYMFRPVPTQTEDFGHESDTIVGGTVAWNQLLPTLDTFRTEGGVTMTYADGVATISSTVARNGIYAPFKYVKDHKYLMLCDMKSENNIDVVLGVTSAAYVNKTVVGNNAWQLISGISNSGTTISGNLYIYAATAFSNLQAKNYMSVDLTQMFGSTIADYIYSLEQANAGAGVAWLRANAPQLFKYNAYDAGSLVSVSGLTSHDMVGFNQMSLNRINGSAYNYNVGATLPSTTTSATISGTNPISMICPTNWSGALFWSDEVVVGQQYELSFGVTGGSSRITVYTTDENGVVVRRLGNYSDVTSVTTNITVGQGEVYIAVSIGTSSAATMSITNLCCHLVREGERDGEYEPYVKHSYPLDSTLTLRGIPKLDNGKLYYDGDTYESSGDVTRKYYSVTFDGSEDDWNWYAGYYQASINLPFVGKYGVSTVSYICDKLKAVSNDMGSSNIGNYARLISSGAGVGFSAPNCTTLEEFKTWVSNNNITFLYELATPTTETADPYTNPQIVDPHGTEQYVGSPIPVGHETTYQRICPISGWDSVSVDVVGVNIFDGTLEQGTFTNQGAESAAGSRIRTKYVLVDSGDVSISTPTSNVYIHEVYCYDANNAFISRLSSGIGASSGTVTVPSGAKYIRFSLRHPDNSTITPSEEIKVQVELSATPTPYQPYNGQTYTSTFPKYKQQVTQDKIPYITKNIGDTYADTLTENLVGGTIAWNQSVPDTTTTHIVSGSIASMNDAVAGNFESVVCDINPVQDLHGYDKPWVGGGGKNIANDNASDYTRPNDYWIVPLRLEQGQTYTVSASFIGSAQLGFTVAYVKSGDRYANFDGFNSFITSSGSVYTKTFTVDATYTEPKLAIYITNPQTTDHLAEFFSTVAHIQVEKGSSATSYEPYSNLCPITGWTGCKVDVSGVNLFGLQNGTFAIGVTRELTALDGVFSYKVNTSASSATFLSNAAIENAIINKTLKAGTYTFKLETDALSASGVSQLALNLSDGTTASNGGSFTLSNDADIASITTPSTWSYNAGTYTLTIQIETGTTATPYTPYNGTTYPVSWQTEAGTVYGGTVDLVTGVLTVTNYGIDMGDLTWTNYKQGGFSAPLSGSIPSTSVTDDPRLMTTMYQTMSASATLLSGQASISNSTLYVVNANYPTDAVAFKTAMTGQTIVYELAQAQTYQLDPVQVACLLGRNNVWNNISNTTVTYPTNHSYQSLSTTHKYYKRINGVESISVGSDVVANVGTDNIIDLTQMFGTTIADYIYNREQSSSSGMGVKFFKSLFPNDDYDYNSGTLISVNASAHVIKDANGNVLHTYPLDSDLVLRGIPKLDTSNKLYYDGDVYQSSGTVTRNYGVVVLDGTSGQFQEVSQATTADGTKYVAYINRAVIGSKDSGLAVVSRDYVWANLPINNLHVGQFDTRASYIRFVLTDQTITTLSAWETYLSNNPITLVYELATPTTEQADPFEENQVIVSNGIEEYTVTEQGDVEMPVGHDSTYYATEVYGGTIDMASGVLTIDMASVDLGSLNWTYHNSGSSFDPYFYATYSGIKSPGAPYNYPINAICSQYNVVKREVGSFVDGSICGDGDATTITQIQVKDNRYTDATTFKNAMKGVQLVYELATPIEISLTPQQIQTLSGQNNIWSNTNGGMSLIYQLPITSLLVKRRDVADVSGKWLTLYSVPITQASDMDFTFIDFLNQYGKKYQYALVPVLAQDQSGVVVQIEGGYTVSDNVDSIFDGVYIADQTNVERVKAGVGYGNIDMNQGVGSITPIGSKYPIVITNSQNQYHNGSIRGTIVPNGFYSNGNLSRIDMVNKRDELEQFLTNKRAKIIKDWNGKIWLVMIMSNVSCSFDDNYGMGIVSFSADWLEVGDPTNQQDLYNAGLINVGGV